MRTSCVALVAVLVAVSEIAVAEQKARSDGYLALRVTANQHPRSVDKRAPGAIEQDLANQNFFYTTEGETFLYSGRDPVSRHSLEALANKAQWASDHRHRR